MHAKFDGFLLVYFSFHQPYTSLLSYKITTSFNNFNNLLANISLCVISLPSLPVVPGYIHCHYFPCSVDAYHLKDEKPCPHLFFYFKFWLWKAIARDSISCCHFTGHVSLSSWSRARTNAHTPAQMKWHTYTRVAHLQSFKHWLSQTKRNFLQRTYNGKTTEMLGWCSMQRGRMGAQCLYCVGQRKRWLCQLRISTLKMWHSWNLNRIELWTECNVKSYIIGSVQSSDGGILSPCAKH